MVCCFCCFLLCCYFFQEDSSSIFSTQSSKRFNLPSRTLVCIDQPFISVLDLEKKAIKWYLKAWLLQLIIHLLKTCWAFSLFRTSPSLFLLSHWQRSLSAGLGQSLVTVCPRSECLLCPFLTFQECHRFWGSVLYSFGQTLVCWTPSCFCCSL